jgi:glycerol dehydrogenase
MKKIICSPGSYIQGNGEINNLADYYTQLGSKGAYLIVDKFIYDMYKTEIESSFIKKKIPYSLQIFGGECSMQEIEKHRNMLEKNDAVIGIGGGKTLDTAKAVSYYCGLPVMIIPTAASTDAPCSRLSVIYKENGEFEKYLPLKANPNIVVIDTDIIAKAPVRFLMAGIGDAFATYYEAEACAKSNSLTMPGGHATLAALALARLCLETIKADGLKAKASAENKVSTQALENVVEANTYLSGIGFESSGLAAAHAIHDGLTVLKETHKFLHGEKVAFGALTQLVLENRSMEEIEDAVIFLRKCSLPTTLKELNLDRISDTELMKAAEASCAKNDTMGNMPFDVAPEDVFAAMKTADRIASDIVVKS